MYQALYRKWRPRTFDDVVGQQHITDTLKRQVRTDRLSHAYLFTGTRGTGKTSCAKILAKAVNCLNPKDGNPCNACSFCLGIDDGSVMDVVEMDAASNNGVDNVRQLRDEAVFSPASAKKRVYIVDEVHMLSVSAFNALLKILEEPPAHLMFILATTELNKVPATILSRCQRHAFKRLDSASIVGRLEYVAEQEGLELRPEAATLIAGLSEGGMRDALSMLDQCAGQGEIGTDRVYASLGLAGNRQIGALLRHISGGDTAAAIGLFEQLWQEGKNPATVLGELASLQRDLLMLSVAPAGGRELLSGGYDSQTLASFQNVFPVGTLIANIERIQSALDAMRSGQARTVSELCLIALCSPGLNDSLPMLRQRVSALEQRLAALGPVPPVQAVAPAQPAPVPQSAPQPAPAETVPPEEPERPPWPEEPPPEEEAFWAPPPETAPAPSRAPAAPPVPARTPAAVPARPAAPEASAAPAASAAAEGAADSGAAGAALWARITQRLGGVFPIGIATILTDPDKVGASLSGDSLVLHVQPGFAMNMLDRPDVTAALTPLAAEAAGRPLRVRVTDSPAAAPEPAAERKLDELARFSVVHFK